MKGLACLFFSLALGLNVELRLDLFDAALASLVTSVTDLEQSLVGAVLFYPNRKTCPRGFRPASEYEGRLPVVGLNEVGRTSKHSLHQDVPYSLNTTCERMISVTGNGMLEVCQHSSKQMPTTLNMKEAVPSFSVLACVRENIVYSPP